MSHDVDADIKRELTAQRGRWMVVQDDATAYRYASKALARQHVRMCRCAASGRRVPGGAPDQAEEADRSEAQKGGNMTAVSDHVSFVLRARCLSRGSHG